MGLGPDIGVALGQTIFGAGDSAFADSNRVPMVFTSTKRLKQTNPAYKNENSQTALYNISRVRDSGMASGIDELSRSMPFIQMSINPNTISWDQPKRMVKRDFKSGSVYFHFTNSKRQNNDILTLEFKGNTGNLNVKGDILSSTGERDSGGPNTGSLKKLLVWQNLYQLTREEMILDGNVKNEFYIMYSSVAMPVDIVFVGIFGSVLKFTESADKPFSRDYTFSFIVQQTIPDLDELLDDVTTFVIDPATTQIDAAK